MKSKSREKETVQETIRERERERQRERERDKERTSCGTSLGTPAAMAAIAINRKGTMADLRGEAWKSRCKSAAPSPSHYFRIAW